MKRQLEILLDQLEDLEIEVVNKRLDLDTDNVYQDFESALYHGQEIAYNQAIRKVKRILEQNF